MREYMYTFQGLLAGQCRDSFSSDHEGGYPCNVPRANGHVEVSLATFRAEMLPEEESGHPYLKSTEELFPEACEGLFRMDLLQKGGEKSLQERH